MSTEPTFKERVDTMLLKALNLAFRKEHPDEAEDKEAFQEYVKQYLENKQNTVEQMREFHKFVTNLSTSKGIQVVALPFYELTWLMTKAHPEGKPLEEAAGILLRKIDALAEKTLDKNFEKYFGVLIRTGDALTKRVFVEWIRLARANKDIARVRYDEYGKLIRMLSTVMRLPRYRDMAYVWSDLYTEMCPFMSGETLLMPEESKGRPTQARTAAIGDIGTLHKPEFVPFISVLRASTFREIKRVLESQHEQGSIVMRWLRRFPLPAAYAQALLFVSVKNSQTGFGDYPVMHLGKVLEVIENRRRAVPK